MENEFTELINNYRALIFKVCNIYCHDDESRKDLFQEIVLQVWKSFPYFRRESEISTWLYKIALNTAISNFKKDSKKPQKTSLTQSELEIPDMSSTDDKEKRKSMHLAIDKLSEIEKAIILLYLDERSYEEISTIIGVSVSNVGVRLNRIKNKLSKLIKSAI